MVDIYLGILEGYTEKKVYVVPRKYVPTGVLISKENFYVNYDTVLYPKNSYLKACFDDLIIRMHSVGLMAKWESYFKLTPPTPMAQDVQLKLKHFYGSFFICACCYVMAIVVFLIEIVVARK